MALTGGSDAVQGATMAWDAVHGRRSEGYNPGKEASRYVADHLLGANPDWGSFAHDVGDLGVGLLSFRRLVPMAVDPAVTGINRTKSLFGVKVPVWDNSRAVGSKVYDSLINRPLLGLSLLPKVYYAYQDYPGRRQGPEE
jgi:hypothetical protein